MRAWLHFLLPVLASLFAAHAAAQSCHVSATAMHTDSSVDPSVVRASVGAVFAGYRNRFGEGEYQGLSAGLAYQHPWFAVGASVPGYRLVRNGEARTELGDIALDARGTVYRHTESGFSMGLGLAATLPTGNGKFGFGMNHTMLMPGLWLSFVREHIILLVEASYGRAIGAHHGAHHGAHTHGALAGSIVQPMNASEIEHGLSVAVPLDPHVRVLGRLFGAVPVADESGEAREIVALGAQGILGIWDLGLEVQLPIVGSPFTSRTVLAVGAEW